MTDLKPAELEKLEFACETYSEPEDGLVDSTQLGNVMRAMDLNPSLETLEKFGVTKKKGDKRFKLDEIIPIYTQLKKEVKDQGCYEDFIECLKLYDKEENGKMQLGELQHSLTALGEKLTEAEVDIVFEDCLDDENSDGEIDYDPFLRRMCEKEPPLNPKKKPAAAAAK